jgi:predicted lipoprotein with Yx(FWY)xxD motif
MSLVPSSGCKTNEESAHESPSVTNRPLSLASATPAESNIVTVSGVYVCKSTGAKKYHYSPDCRGLSNCKHEIVKMDRDDAEARGLGLCGWED